jgi:hypothetical protein
MVTLLDRNVCGELTISTTAHRHIFELGNRRLTLLIRGNPAGRFAIRYYPTSRWRANSIDGFFADGAGFALEFPGLLLIHGRFYMSTQSGTGLSVHMGWFIVALGSILAGFVYYWRRKGGAACPTTQCDVSADAKAAFTKSATAQHLTVNPYRSGER